MTPSKNRDLPPFSSEAEEEEIFELTEVLDEEASETVIEFSSSLEELDSLDLKSLLAQGGPAEPPAEAPEMGTKDTLSQDSLDDLLSSLQGMPDEFPEPGPEAAPPEELEFEEPPPPPAPRESPFASLEEEFSLTPAAVPLAAAPALPAGLSEDQMRELVRQVVREIAERLCREMFPAVASEVVSREIAALKKSLEEDG